MSWQFDWLTSWDEIWSEPFVARWHEWMKTSPTAHVFFHPTLVRVWVDTYLPLRRMEPRFLVATNGGCTVFLPMVLWRRNWKNAFQRLLIPVGYSDYDYHDPIVVGETDSRFWPQFWDVFHRELSSRYQGRLYDIIELTGIKEVHIAGDVNWSQDDVCPFIDLSPFNSGEEFLGTLSSKHRYNLLRRQRQLQSNGSVSFEVCGPSHEDKSRCELSSLLDHHSRRWPKAYKARGLHNNLVQSGIPEGLVHFSVFSLNGTAISWRIGFIFRERFYSYMPAYNAEYEHFSPGQLHLLLCISDAIGRRLKVFDHLRGKENYKAGWTNRVDHLYSLSIRGNAFGSSLRNLAAGQIRPALGRVLGRCGKGGVHG